MVIRPEMCYVIKPGEGVLIEPPRCPDPYPYVPCPDGKGMCYLHVVTEFY